MLYEIVVQGRPVPQPRHKTMPGGDGKKSRHVFNTPRVKAWKDLISLNCAAGRMPKGYEGPVTVQIEFRFLRPKSHFGPDGLLRAANNDQRVFLGQVGAQACGDNDNLEKAVWDALEKKGVIKNDAQVWYNQTKSLWTCEPKLEGATIRLWTDEQV